MRDSIVLYINGKRHTIGASQIFMTLSDYLRYQKSLTGTKVVCAEGDCGACSVLYSSIHDLKEGKLHYRSINSCIALLSLLDCSHIITVEGITEENGMHAVQKAFVDAQGAQCGFCTPGFICALTATLENRIEENKQLQGEAATKKIMNGLTGNLCRCTGYLPIKEACATVDTSQMTLMRDRYHSETMIQELTSQAQITLNLSHDKKQFFAPVSINEAVKFKSQHSDARLISSATDLGVLINKEKFFPTKLLSLNHISELHSVKNNGDFVRIGARVNLNQLENFLEKNKDNGLIELAYMLKIFASPQIKNTATIVGNIANASPIADTIPAMMALNAQIEIVGPKGTRTIDSQNFYLGYKKLDLAADEIITFIQIPHLKKKQKLKLYKVSNRKDMDISTVTFASVYSLNNNTIEDITVVYGGVGPVVKVCDKTGLYLKGKTWKESTFKEAGKILLTEITPISDMRSSKEYRNIVAKNLLLKFCFEGESHLEVRA
ncbi:MAG: FAD binding domain-containing protein [Bacteriovoracaceae bacterium]